MARYRIFESEGARLQCVRRYADLEIHHPRFRGREPGRTNGLVQVPREEVLRMHGRMMVSKDFICRTRQDRDACRCLRRWGAQPGRSTARTGASTCRTAVAASPSRGCATSTCGGKRAPGRCLRRLGRVAGIPGWLRAWRSPALWRARAHRFQRRPPIAVRPVPARPRCRRDHHRCSRPARVVRRAGAGRRQPRSACRPCSGHGSGAATWIGRAGCRCRTGYPGSGHARPLQASRAKPD